MFVFEIHQCKITKACRPKARQTDVKENSITNSLKLSLQKIKLTKRILNCK
ncbi:MAG: hypothetical protein LBP59_00795 [Planctomycetaceae bacterium]|nr:hypothetical protein [Planctomycetaceae bacterium]